MTGPRRCGTVPGVAEHRRLPLFTSLGGYDPGWLRGDVVAGLTVWAVLVPEALAYAAWGSWPASSPSRCSRASSSGSP